MVKKKNKKTKTHLPMQETKDPRVSSLCPWVGKIPWRRAWRPTPVFLPGESHGQRSLVGYSPWGCRESDTTELLHCHFSLLCIGKGNGNPLQCSCLENPREGGAWWAVVFGVAQSWTRLKRLSSSSSSRPVWILVSNCYYSSYQPTLFPYTHLPLDS